MSFPIESHQSLQPFSFNQSPDMKQTLISCNWETASTITTDPFSQLKNTPPPFLPSSTAGCEQTRLHGYMYDVSFSLPTPAVEYDQLFQGSMYQAPTFTQQDPIYPSAFFPSPPAFDASTCCSSLGYSTNEPLSDFLDQTFDPPVYYAYSDSLNSQQLSTDAHDGMEHLHSFQCSDAKSDDAAPGKGRRKYRTITKEKRHVCPICSHKSRRRHNLLEHMQTHDPNRPRKFICGSCDRAFARKYDMRRHEKIHFR